MRSHSSGAGARSWPSDAGARSLHAHARHEAVETDADTCVSGCVRNGFGLYYYFIYLFTTNERQQRHNMAASASGPLLVPSEARTPMITTWKVRGQRTQRRVLRPGPICSGPVSGADPVLN